MMNSAPSAAANAPTVRFSVALPRPTVPATINWSCPPVAPAPFAPSISMFSVPLAVNVILPVCRDSTLAPGETDPLFTPTAPFTTPAPDNASLLAICNSVAETSVPFTIVVSPRRTASLSNTVS